MKRIPNLLQVRQKQAAVKMATIEKIYGKELGVCGEVEFKRYLKENGHHSLSYMLIGK